MPHPTRVKRANIFPVQRTTLFATREIGVTLEIGGCAMMDQDELSQFRCSGQDVVCAWILAVTLIFGLVVISAIQFKPAGDPGTVGREFGSLCQPQDDCEPTGHQVLADDPAFWLNYRFTEILPGEDFF